MTVFRTRIGEKEIILVGTAHISKKSIELVEKTILEEQPDIVGVELDELRLQQLLHGNKWENTNILELIQTGQAGLILLNLFLSNMQKQLGEKVGVKPGEEMKVAVERAKEMKKPLLLMDRSLQITMKRAMAEISLWEKLKLGGSLIMGLFGDNNETINEKKIEEMKESDLVTKLMLELSKQYPKLKKTLVDERDAYIAHSLIQSPGKKIVGVIGIGHAQGIIQHLQNYASGKKEEMPTLNELIIVPTKKKNHVIEWGIPIAFIAILAWIFYTQGAELSIHFIGFWVIGHGVLAGSGALLAGAQWKTVLGVVATAWLAALHPLIAAGWIAAAIETKENSPAMKDFTNLNQLNSVGDFRRNRVTQILLITVLTNLGSMAATILVIPYLISTLG
ncbi:MAG: TraB/GumN family protein [Candidatus Diapherotrites archaeon]